VTAQPLSEASTSRRPRPALAAVSAPEVPQRALLFEATVPRSTVHRAAVAEVFVTDSAIGGEDTFEVAAQLPRRHFMNENASTYDLMLAVEVVRQAGVLVAHRYYFVPIGMQFIFDQLSLQTDSLANLSVGLRPAQLVVTLAVSPVTTRHGKLRGLDFTGRVSIDGRAAFSGRGGLRVLTPAGYQALRDRGREAKLAAARPLELVHSLAAPAAVGRKDAANVVITEPVVLSDRTVRASIVPDTGHPHMFDHQLDHLPGNVELEACRQAAVAAVAALHGVPADTLVLAGVSANFASFAELDVPTRVEVTVGDFTFDDEQGCPVVATTARLVQSAEDVVTAEIGIAQWR
jgi:hypothetical protein